jgi:hypothetical protein
MKKLLGQNEFGKNSGMYLGKWRNKNPRFKNIKLSTKPVKALGVFHGYAIDLEMIWLEKINKIKSCNQSSVISKHAYL